MREEKALSESMNQEDFDRNIETLGRIARSYLEPEILTGKIIDGETTVTVTIGGKSVITKTASPEYLLPYLNGYLAAICDHTQNTWGT